MKGKILILDDNPIDIKVAASTLERLGFACVGFTDHEEAIKWLSAEMPTAILLDLQMPKISGFEMLPILKGLIKSEAVPILIISGKNQSADVVKAIKLGASDYVIKPIDPLIMQEKIERVTAPRRTDYHSVALPQDKQVQAYLSKPLTVLTISEFGLKISSEEKIVAGDVLQVTGLPTELFGTGVALVRCLNVVVNKNLYVAETTFIGLQETHRQIIRKNCRQVWINSRKDLT